LQKGEASVFLIRVTNSIVWRQKVWHDGFHLLTSNPRHLLVGVGMEFDQVALARVGLFDNGRMPMGHMHSDYFRSRSSAGAGFDRLANSARDIRGHAMARAASGSV